MRVFENLEPKEVFYYFEDICSIPHGSGNTQKISDYCVNFAKEHGLNYRQEECGNVVIWKDATSGYEQADTVILQGHMDMVAVKDADCPLDLEKDGLIPEVDGAWIQAKGSSLGGDDGIAVAYALAILAADDIPVSICFLLFFRKDLILILMFPFYSSRFMYFFLIALIFAKDATKSA